MDYHPVILVGSLYRIVFKVLANRLRDVLGLVVSNN